jgi:dCMP deaminase
VGAVVVQDRRIVATGYNGAPKGLAHCNEIEGGCLRQRLGIPSGERHEMCRALHAEQNAIIQAATSGQSVEGATIYITHQPCVICAKMIINAGIEKIIVKEGYPDELSTQLLEEAGRKIVMLGDQK